MNRSGSSTHLREVLGQSLLNLLNILILNEVCLLSLIYDLGNSLLKPRQLLLKMKPISSLYYFNTRSRKRMRDPCVC